MSFVFPFGRLLGVHPTCGFREDVEISASERIGRSSHVEFLNQMKKM
jgi:hypothetical protein